MTLHSEHCPIESGVLIAGRPRIIVWPTAFEKHFLAARAAGSSFAEAIAEGLRHCDPLAEYDRTNKVTLNGRNLLRDSARGATTFVLDTFALGTDGTAVTGLESALGAQVYSDALADFDAGVDGQVICNYYLTTIQANDNTLREAGLMKGGLLFARGTYTAIPKDISKAVTYQWTLPFGAA